MAPLAFRDPNSTDHPNLRGAIEFRSRPARSFNPRMLCLTRRICVVQCKSGSIAASFGVRHLAAAFLSFALLAVMPQRIRSLWNQPLTNCNFCNSFILTFMQNAGGVGGFLNLLTLTLSVLKHSASISFVLIFLRTLLHFFCTHKKHSHSGGGGASLGKSSKGFRIGRSGFLLALRPAFSSNVEGFDGDLSCV